jgi:D-alanyl-D-alanine dipeptidase
MFFDRRCLYFIAVPSLIWLLASTGRANPDLVDIKKVDPAIVVDLRYATPRNITGKRLYRADMPALILPSVAQQLSGAQKYLHQFRYGLKIWDAYRPKEAQELLWKFAQKDQFVANPEKGFGSTHSWGVSVDATMVDDGGEEVTMPTAFDQFTAAAFWRYTGSDILVKQHLTLLQRAMAHNGFYGVRVEWWHFTTADWKKYVPYWEQEETPQQTSGPANRKPDQAD